jgi:cyanophycinase
MLKPVALAAVALLTSHAAAQGYICADGGGGTDESPFADQVFGWMVEKGAKGAAVIIGSKPYPEDTRAALLKRLGAASAELITLTADNANDDAVAAQIRAASIVFIRGGDQSDYVKYWNNSKSRDAIRSVYAKGGVIAGTSAGCAVLGSVTYDSIHGSLYPLEALADARHPDLSLTTDFLNFTTGVLFDTHFSHRGRISRLPNMIAAHSIDSQPKTPLVGIGVDERTALCISPDGRAEVKGEGRVTLLRLSASSRTVMTAGAPPAITDVEMLIMPREAAFDLPGTLTRPWHKAPPAPEDSFGIAVIEELDGGGQIPPAHPARAALGLRVTTRVFSSDDIVGPLTRELDALKDPATGAVLLMDEGAAATISGDAGIRCTEATKLPRRSVMLFQRRESVIDAKGAAGAAPIAGLLQVLPPGSTVTRAGVVSLPAKQ